MMPSPQPEVIPKEEQVVVKDSAHTTYRAFFQVRLYPLFLLCANNMHSPNLDQTRTSRHTISHY